MESTWTDTTSPDLLVGAPHAVPGVCVGILATADPSEGLRVVYGQQSLSEPVSARTIVPVSPDDAGRDVLLVFENGHPDRPIITGFIQEQPVVLSLTPEEKQTFNDTHVDGKRVFLEAEKEIVLRCGKSSVMLRADGKIIIKGMEVVSRAKGTNKVKGGTVRIN